MEKLAYFKYNLNIGEVFATTGKNSENQGFPRQNIIKTKN